MTSSQENVCPECGRILPPESLHQVCPACLMAQALASRTILGEDEATSATPAPTPEEMAEKFPQFEIIECLGRGGMGVVYKARQKSLQRLVAIKILSPERMGEERFAKRFASEAATLAKLSHPNIVTIHDFGQTGELFYIVMEYVDGVNLRDLLREGSLAPEQALSIVPPICDALQYAHEKGIVHRDIKPENLLLDRDGRIKIADFGIASLIGGIDEKAGTPAYMAPEQSGLRSEVDHRADIYALGIVLYEMLTGERPAKEMVLPSRKVHVDVRLDEIVLRALEKTPELRYQSAGEFRTMLQTIPGSPISGTSESSPSAHRIVGARRFMIGALLLLIGGLFLGVTVGGFQRYRSAAVPVKVAGPAVALAEKESPLLLASLRFITLPEDTDLSLLSEPRELLKDKRVRVMGVYRAVIPTGMESVMHFNWVPGRRGNSVLPRGGVIFLQPSISNEEVSYHFGTQWQWERAAGDNSPQPARVNLAERKVMMGQPDIVEVDTVSGGWKEVVVLTFEKAEPHATPEELPPATGGYAYGPVIERTLNDPLLSERDCLIDFETGRLADKPATPELTNQQNSPAAMLDQILPIAVKDGMDAVGKVGAGISRSESGMLGIGLDSSSYSWRSRDASSWISIFSGESPVRPIFRLIPYHGQGLFNEQAVIFMTQSHGFGLLQVTGFSEDGKGMKIRYKMVEEPSIGWNPEPGTNFISPDFKEEADMQGGAQRSDYRVCIRGKPYDIPWSYDIIIRMAGKSDPIYQLDGVGGYQSYINAKEDCRAWWKSMDPVVAITDRNGKSMRSIHLLAMNGEKVIPLELPDYIQRAFQQVGIPQAYRMSFSEVEKWEGDDLHVKYLFDSEKGKYSSKVVITVTWHEGTGYGAVLKSCVTTPLEKY